jgi:hypothetical protein
MTDPDLVSVTTAVAVVGAVVVTVVDTMEGGGEFAAVVIGVVGPGVEPELPAAASHCWRENAIGLFVPQFDCSDW